MEFSEINASNEPFIENIRPGQQAAYWVHANRTWYEKSKKAEGLRSCLIYTVEHKEPIGFIVFGQHYLDERLTHRVPGVYEIIHMVIDSKYQGRGYGRQATQTAMMLLSQYKDCHEIVIAYSPGNVRARKLYASLGFVEYSQNYEGDTLMRIPVEQKRVSGLNG